MKKLFYPSKITGLLPLGLFLICLALPAAAKVSLPHRTGTQCEQLWPRLDLDQPGLADVKARVAAHDDAGAMKALNAYFQGRFPKNQLHGRGGSTEGADNAIAFRFRHRADEEYFTLHKDFDWKKGPAAKEHHWLSLFCSLGVLPSTAQVYLQTNDPKYAAGTMAIFNDWADHCPPGSGSPSWSLATTMTRVINFAAAFPYLIYWSDWPIEQEARFLNSIADHADVMAASRGPGNQDCTNSEDLMRISAIFPEFKDAPNWGKTGHDRLAGKIFDDTLPDGSQKELCSGYDKGAVSTYTGFAASLKAMGKTPDAAFEARLEKMYDWLLRMAQPDGDIPTNGDSAGGTARGFLKKGAELFHRPDMDYVASGGKSGTAPAFLDAALPDAGYYTLRSGWDPDALYLFMDIARQEPLASHQYNDALHIFLYAYGRDFFPATGTYTYGGDASAKAHATASQNTVAVDNTSQAGVASVTHAFFSSSALSFLDGSQAGYPGITHRRQVLFVRPDPNAAQALPYFVIIDRLTGDGSHSADQYFHLPPDANPTIDTAQARFQTTFPKGPNLIVENLLKKGITTETFTDDMSPHQSIKIQRPVVVFRQKGALPMTYITLLFPYPKEAPTYTATVLSPETDAGIPHGSDMIAVRVTQGSVEDTLMAGSDSFSVPQNSEKMCAGMIRTVNGAAQPTWVPVQKPITGKFAAGTTLSHDDEPEPDASPSQSSDSAGGTTP